MDYVMGLSRQAFYTDDLCQAQAVSSPKGPDRSEYESCMVAKGWQKRRQRTSHLGQGAMPREHAVGSERRRSRSSIGRWIWGEAQRSQERLGRRLPDGLGLLERQRPFLSPWSAGEQRGTDR